jgi:hypothetical protein
MGILDWLALGSAGGLLLYLSCAVLFPERFS